MSLLILVIDVGRSVAGSTAGSTSDVLDNLAGAPSVLSTASPFMTRGGGSS